MPHMKISSRADRRQPCKYIYISHMSSLQSTMWPETLVYIHFTLLAYTPEHTCLPYCICMSHHLATVLYILNLHHCTYQQNKQKNATLIYHTIAICASNKSAPQMLHVCHMPKLLNVHQWGKYAYVYATNELTRHKPHDEECYTQKTMMSTFTMMTMQPNCISWVGYWPIQPKLWSLKQSRHTHKHRQTNRQQFACL